MGSLEGAIITAIGVIAIIALVMACFSLYLVATIRDSVYSHQFPTEKPVKKTMLQTMSGRVFTVKEKRKAVYNDDLACWKKENKI